MGYVMDLVVDVKENTELCLDSAHVHQMHTLTFIPFTALLEVSIRLLFGLFLGEGTTSFIALFLH